MFERVLKHYDIMTVGEGPGIHKDVGLKYVGHDRGELNMIFHLDHMFLGHGPKGKFDPVEYGWNEIKQIFSDWYNAMGESGWVSIFLDNHDFPRLVSRFGNDQEYRIESAKLLSMLVLTLRGTACIYQGSEIGMSNVHFDKIDEYRDVETINFHKEFTEAGLSEEEFLKRVHEHGRDNVRTPIQWDASHHSGFTTGQPWINVNPNYTAINAEADINSENSIYKWYQQLLSFRKENKTLVYGDWQVLSSHEDLYIYTRVDDEAEFLIILNHSNNVHNLDLQLENYSLILHNNIIENPSDLSPWDARLYKKA